MENTRVIINILIFSIASFFIGCSNGKIGKDSTSEPVQHINLNKLEYYNPYQLEIPNEFDYVITKYLNVSCPNCVDDIKKLSAVNEHYPNCKIQLVCHSEDKFMYFKHLIKENKFSQTNFPFLLDTANVFLSNNPDLKMDLTHIVIVTDPKDRILKIVELDQKKIEEAISQLK